MISGGHPKVTIHELDLSTRVPGFAGVYGGIVVQAKKGEVNYPVLVTSENDFLEKFTPNGKVEIGYDLGYFSALTYLQKSDKLWVVRAAKTTPGTLTALTGTVSGAKDGTTLTGVGTAFEDELHVGDIIQIDTGADLETKKVKSIESATGLTLTTALAAAHSAVEASAYDYSGVVKFGGVLIRKSSSLVANAAFDMGLTQAEIDNYWGSGGVGDGDTDTRFIVYGKDPGAWNNNLKVVIVAADSREPNSDLIVYVYAMVDGVWTLAENPWTVSLIPGKKDGYGQNMYIEDVLKGSNYVRASVNPALTSETELTGTVTIVAGSTDVAGTLTAFNTELAEGDRIKVGNEYRTVVTITSATAIVVDYPFSAAYTDAEVTGYVTVKVTLEADDPLVFVGGSDGSAVTSGMMQTAATTLMNSASYDLTVFMDGGFTDPAYQKKLIEICEYRKDCVPILSTPYADEASSDYLNAIVDYRMGAGAENLASVNSSYATLYSPHVEIYDKYNDRNLWIAPDGVVGGAISETGTMYELWYPVGGWRRGNLLVLDVKRRFSEGEMDVLYDAGINPIRFQRGKGIAIWGQKTLLTRPSALDRLNVRLLLVVIEPAIKAALEDFLFELNDVATRSTAKHMVDSYMDNVKARRGVYDFLSVCDTTNNTPQDIDEHKMNMWLFIKPVISVEYIPFTVIITRTGMSFSLASQSLVSTIR